MLNASGLGLNEVDVDPANELLFAPVEHDDHASQNYIPCMSYHSGADENLRDLALTMVVYAARDIRAYNRRKANGKTDRKLMKNANEATEWLTYTSDGSDDGGFLPFSLCCRILWGDRVDAMRAGKRIAENPDAVASIALPRNDDDEPAAEKTTIQGMVKQGLIAMH